MNKVRILIVEKELTISEEILIRLLENNFEIVSTQFCPVKAFEFLKNNNVDIVLIDASLNRDISAFKLARLIKTRLKIPCIFMLSEEEDKYMEKAKKLNSGAILTVPYSYDQVKISVHEAIKNYSLISSKIKSCRTRRPLLDSVNNCLFLKKEKHFQKVDFDDILWFKSEGDFTNIYTVNGTYVYAKLLTKIEEKLPSKQFIRIHGSYLVNIFKIDAFEENSVVIDNADLPVSNEYLEKVSDLMHVV